MDNYQIFISIYNEIETNISKIDKAPEDANMKWLEDNLIDDSKIKNKLFLSRITRNYIQHNPDYKDFVSINDGMIEFLKEMKVFVFAKLKTAKNIMSSGKKLGITSDSENLNDVINLVLSKNYDYIPIINEDLTTGILSKEAILKLYQEGFIKKSTKVGDIDKKLTTISKDTIKFIKEDKLAEEIVDIFEKTQNTKKPVKLILVTTTGTVKGNLLGLITKEDVFNI